MREPTSTWHDGPLAPRRRGLALLVALMIVSAARPDTPANAPPSPDAVRARDLLDAGDVEGARRLAEPLTNGSVPDALALQTLGRVARREGRTDDAVKLLEAAVAADPSSSDAHLHLGGAYVDKLRSVSFMRQLGWARKIRAVFQEAGSLDLQSCEAHRALAEFYLEAPKFVGGSPSKARAEAAMLREHCAAQSHVAFALNAQTVGDLAGAETECIAALQADANRGEAFALLGWIERLRGLAADSPPTDASRDLLGAAPAWHRALHDAGRAGALPGPNIEKAEGSLRPAIQREKEPAAKARLRWALGLAHQIRGDKDSAWREYTAALALDPSLDVAVRCRESLARRPLPAPAPASGP